MLDTAQQCLGLTCFLLQGTALPDELGVTFVHMLWGESPNSSAMVNCLSINPAQDLALIHLETFQHEVNRYKKCWSYPDRKLEKLLTKSFTVGRSSEKWDVSVFGGTQDLLHSQGKQALDVSHGVPCPLLPAPLGLSPMLTTWQLCLAASLLKSPLPVQGR